MSAGRVRGSPAAGTRPRGAAAADGPRGGAAAATIDDRNRGHRRHRAGQGAKRRRVVGTAGGRNPGGNPGEVGGPGGEPVDGSSRRALRSSFGAASIRAASMSADSARAWRARRASARARPATTGSARPSAAMGAPPACEHAVGVAHALRREPAPREIAIGHRRDEAPAAAAQRGRHASGLVRDEQEVEVRAAAPPASSGARCRGRVRMSSAG